MIACCSCADCVNAIVAGHPSKILPVEIVDFWSQSFERASKNMVLRAALQFLEAPSPPRVLGGTGGGENKVPMG